MSPFSIGTRRSMRASDGYLSERERVPENRWLSTKDATGDAYDARYDQRAAARENLRGEAYLVMRYGPARPGATAWSPSISRCHPPPGGFLVAGSQVPPEHLTAAEYEAGAPLRGRHNDRHGR
jgi:hypothetical protein